MHHVVLLGDSSFDNAAYVGNGPAVIDQVRRRLPEGWRASLGAVDGSVIADVHRQLERLPEDADHLVVSVGGNDVLAEVGVLGVRVSTVGEGIRALADIQDRFEGHYNRLLRTLAQRGRPTVVCTIYHPRFPDPGLQGEAVTALSLFNDGIIRTAHQVGFPVLDLRAICTEDEDYSTPIEPSTIGGAKLAQAICEAVSHPDFKSRRTILLP